MNAVDEKQIKVDGEKKRLYAAIDTESKLLWLSTAAAGSVRWWAFLYHFTENHGISAPRFWSVGRDS